MNKMNRGEQEDTTIYKVVVNHEEQYSIWPADGENPLGWRDAGTTGAKRECLGYVKQVWTDMRPLSLRKEMEDTSRRANDTPTDYVKDVCIHHLFEAQVERTPDAVAVFFEDQQLSYRDLNRRANQLAHHLQKLGVGPEVTVGLSIERSVEMVVGMIGILKAGGVYVPLDPVYPTKRVASMFQDAQVSVLLTQKRLLSKLRQYGAYVICLDRDWPLISKQSEENVYSRASAANLSHVIYTSGSTGMPKGVMVTHASLCQNLRGIRAHLRIISDDVYLHTASIAFTSSLRQLLVPLSIGATVVITTPEQRTNPLALFDLIKRQGATIMDTVASFWENCTLALARLEPQSRNSLLDNKLRLILSSGGELPCNIPTKWSSKFKHGASLVNMYGQTETIGNILVYPIPGKNDDSLKVVPLGPTIAHTRVYLFDKHLHLVPVGVPAELHIGGLSLARGYLNRPELTAEKFVPNPFSDEPGSRLYRTGDRGCCLPNGTIEFLGRIDLQINIRGFCIEPGEIETVMKQHSGIWETVVVARDDVPGDKRLVAYFVPDPQDAPTISELRSLLDEKLPEYMVPSAFVMLDALPCLPNGKIDRLALPAPDRIRPELGETFVSPRTRVEVVLTEIFAQVLGLDQVGIHDNFFELGGHSLQAATIIYRLHDEMQVGLSLESLLKTPTVAGLASEIAQRESEQADDDGHSAPQLPTIVPAPDERHLPFPLTDIQQAYWIGRTGIFTLGHVSTHRYIEIESVDLDLERLSLTWQQLIDRHEMLRTIVLRDGQQQTLKQKLSYEIEVSDLRGQGPETAEANLQAVRQHMSHQVLPSDQWPLFEIRASCLTERRMRLHFSFDALILDAWSRFILFREWAQLYKNSGTPLPRLDLSFRDYVLAELAFRDSELYRRSQNYWWERLGTLPPAPELPLAKDPSMVTHPRFVRHDAELEPETWLRLRSHAKRRGLTPSGVLLSAYAEVLKVWSKAHRFTINLTVFNRLPLHPQVNEIVGDFTSLTLLAVEDSDEDTFEARAQCLQQQLWNDLNNRYVSGVEVLREMAKRQGGVPRAEMPVVFTSALTHDTQSNDPNPMSWMGDVVYSITQTPQVWIDHQVFEESGVLAFNWDVVDELFPEGLVGAMFDSYCRFLQCLADDEGSWQDTWPETVQTLVPPEQLEQRASINATEAPVAADMLHTLFARQVPQRPDQPAVVGSDRTLTYEELFRCSNQVGYRLRRLGARPNTLVAVVMEKCWEQVVAVLGTLASGAAYLPIDAGLAKERLWYLLEHGEVEFILTQSNLDQTLEWPDGLQRICVDSEELAGVGHHPLDAVQGPEDLAYVIYTSGSTGLPKGVMIDHRGAVNTILDINKRFGVGPNDRVLALSALSFDLSVYDIFGTLAAGGTIVMPESTDARDPSRWAQLIAQENVTIWNSVPALMELLVEYVADRPGLTPLPLRLVMMSGDWIPVTLPDQIKVQIEEIQIISLGGATEASIWSIIYPIETVDSDWTNIPYGQPMVNQQFYVFNEALAHCPVWVPGQLFIGGIGLAKGYWGDAEKTQASFITHPRTGERLYRTGDLGRYLPDGNIEFMGREDFQVKIQGYRVELEEIEAALAQHPGVRTVVVTAIGELQGEKRLVAYIVPEQETVPQTSHLRQFLQQKLPEYMVPSAFVMLDQLPLTPNGKVDRKALPDPGQLPAESLHRPAEVTNFTDRIGQLVASIIKIDSIDPGVNLLTLGATSVDMIRIANLLDSELNFRPEMGEFYRLPTVEGLARAYEQYMHQSQMPEEAAERAIVPTHESVVAGFELLLDPEERETFRNEEPGLRRGDDEALHIDLDMAEPDDTLRKKYAERRSYRQFLPKPIPFAQYSELLGCLRQIRLDGKPKYLYGSAGGLYPVQTYLYVKPGRVEALDAGIYYFHPTDCRLVLLSKGVDVDRDVYDPIINGPIFDEAAFGLFLIAQLSGIVPMYGERSMHYATIEAGLMSQLLEASAPACGIGLCQIGDMDFKRIRHLFALDQSHVLVHSLLGGPIDTHLANQSSSFQEVDFGAVGGDNDWEEGEI